MAVSKMKINKLRAVAISLGADEKKLYGTSKQALVIIIDKLKREQKGDKNG